MPELEYLTDELKHLVAWGAAPHRLPVMPNLRELVDLSGCPNEATAGYVMQRYLRDAIDSLSGTYEVLGYQISAERLNRAFKLLLRFEGPPGAQARRQRAIITLKLRYQVDQFRRPHGAERELMRLLARHMLESLSNRQVSA